MKKTYTAPSFKASNFSKCHILTESSGSNLYSTLSDKIGDKYIMDVNFDDLVNCNTILVNEKK